MHIKKIMSLVVLGLVVFACAEEPATKPVNTAIVPVPKLENDSYNWEARHQAVLELKKTMRPEVVMIGDSITHFWGGEPAGKAPRGPKSWKDLFGDRQVLNMGFGWDRTQNVLWRLEHGEFDDLHPKFVVLNIGTNNFKGTKNARENTPAEVAEGVLAICEKLHTMSPDTKIVLMGVLPRVGKPADAYQEKIPALNKILAEYPSKNLNITFLDITSKFLDKDGNFPKDLTSDGTHPTEKGYQIWADALKPILSGDQKKVAE